VDYRQLLVDNFPVVERILGGVARRRRLAEADREDFASFTYLKLIEGDFVAAEAELVAGLRHGELPLLNYLSAAYCAQEQGMIEKRDEYLANAQRSAPQHAAAVSMMQARLQQVAQQNEQALATLAELRQSQPRNRYVLHLLAEVYQALSDWTGLVELVPELRAQGAFSNAEIDALEMRAHRELLQLTLPSGSREVLTRAWNAVPKPLRSHPSVLAIYARQLVQQNEMREAEAVLREALDIAGFFENSYRGIQHHGAAAMAAIRQQVLPWHLGMATAQGDNLRVDVLDISALRIVLLQEKFLNFDIRETEQHHAFSGLTVAPSPARFLVVSLDGAGQIEVNDTAHIRLIHAHAKGVGGHHDTV